MHCVDRFRGLTVQKLWGNQYHPQIISYTIQQKHNKQTAVEDQT